MKKILALFFFLSLGASLWADDGSSYTETVATSLTRAQFEKKYLGWSQKHALDKESVHFVMPGAKDKDSDKYVFSGSVSGATRDIPFFYYGLNLTVKDNSMTFAFTEQAPVYPKYSPSDKMKKYKDAIKALTTLQ